MTIMGLDSDQCLPIANYFKPLFHTDNSNIVDQLKEQREVVASEQNFSNFSSASRVANGNRRRQQRSSTLKSTALFPVEQDRFMYRWTIVTLNYP